MATKRIVLVGGGHGHVQVIKALHRLARPQGVEITLIDPQPLASYSGMMPGCVAELYEVGQTQIKLGPLAARSDIELLQTACSGLDRENKEVLCEDGSRVPYDIVSFDVGSNTAGASRVAGVAENAIATRPISRLEAQVREKEAVMLAANPALARICVVGCGAAGVELALALHGRFVGKFERVEVTMLSSHDGVLLEGVPMARRLVTQHLLDKGFNLLDHSVVSRVEPGEAVLSDGRTVPFDICLWATGAEKQPFISQANLGGVDVEANGFIVVNRFLQSPADPSVFAAGDCSSMLPNPAPKAGVYAVRSGPVLLHNFMVQLTGEGELREFAPQPDFLRLLATGDRYAVGIKFGIAFRGRWVWTLKDRIDVGFMRLFDVALMPTPEESMELDVRQYDAAPEPPRSDLSPEEAAALLCTSVEEEDCGPMDVVLKHMATDEEYCAAVVAAVHANHSQ